MKKTEMLKKNYEFKNVLVRGKFYTSNEIQAVILKNNNQKILLGIAIGTKNGKSFQRNRAKRLIRESYRILEPKLIEGYSIIILIKKKFNLNNLKFDNVLDNMNNCFKKAKIVKREEEKI